MSWDETRGGVVTTSRRMAHTDDAKARTDETHHTRRAPRARGRSLVPTLIGGIVVLLLVGGSTAAFFLTRGEEPSASSRGAGTEPTGSAGADAALPTVHPTTGLPLEPTYQDVTYAGINRCVERGHFLLSRCPNAFRETLTCPEGLCTIFLFIGPRLMSLGAGSPEEVVVTFRAGDPTVQFRGTNRSSTCPGRLTVDGSRQSDGGYEIRVVNGLRAGEGDGSCSPPSEAVWEISLASPP